MWGSPQLRGKAAAALVLLTAAAVGTCVWAVVVSSRNVNTEADRFWAVIGDARDQVGHPLVLCNFLSGTPSPSLSCWGGGGGEGGSSPGKKRGEAFGLYTM